MKDNWKQQNKDRWNAYMREYRQNNKNKIKKQKQISYQKHKEKILKQKKEYNKMTTEKRAIYQKEYYRKNKNKILLRQRKYRQENLEEIRTRERKYYHLRYKIKCQERYKKYFRSWLQIIKEHYGQIACSVCGYDKNFKSLDFHHKNPKEKEYEISKVLNRKPTPERIEEMKKCLLLCKNCHYETHFPNGLITDLFQEHMQQS